MTFTHDVEAAGEILRLGSVAVLTGAGVSTDSGIPDYRGPNAVAREPMTYQEFLAGSAHRSRYWARNQVGWHHLLRAVPNASHCVLARVEAAGKIRGIITQNIDRLHQRAGSFSVVDLHGRYDQVLCMQCRSLIPRSTWGQLLDQANPDFVWRSEDPADIDFAPDADADIQYDGDYVVPDCPVCGGVVKPNVVFFGESAGPDDVAHAAAVVDASRAVLVLGSSLTVYSGRRFVRRALRHNKPVVIVNRGQTRSDTDASIKIDVGVAEFLEAVEPLWSHGV